MPVMRSDSTLVAGKSLLARGILDPRVWLLFVSLQLPALRPLSKYLPTRMYFVIPFYLIGMFIVYVVVLHSETFRHRSKQLLGRAWTLVAILSLVSAINFYVFPIADGLKPR